MITVHHLNNSRSQRILWLLEELGVPYDIKAYTRDLTTNLAPPELKAAHPLQPVRYVESWRASLAALSRWKDAQAGGERFVIAGDLNASAAHPAYRELADGLTDAHRAAGLGCVRTWPYGRRLPPLVQLDHVLSRGFEVVGAGTFVVGDTDHAAVWATLR